MDLHILPKVRDGLSYLYAEHCKIDQEAKAIALHDATGKTPVPCAALSLLMLGPGTSITHAAIRALADSGCLVAWVGEEGSASTPRDWARRARRGACCGRPGSAPTPGCGWRWSVGCTGSASRSRCRPD